MQECKNARLELLGHLLLDFSVEGFRRKLSVREVSAEPGNRSGHGQPLPVPGAGGEADELAAAAELDDDAALTALLFADEGMVTCTEKVVSGDTSVSPEKYRGGVDSELTGISLRC